MDNSFVKYKDLLTIKGYDIETNKENFVFLPLDDEYVIGKYQKRINMLEYDERIPVRAKVYDKLIRVSKKLKSINNNYKLMVVYGFRDMKKQEQYFNEILQQEKNKFSDELEMFEYIHTKIAVPIVSGHPTGGAVDISIVDMNNNIIEFGSDILDYDTSRCCYYATDISDEAKKNRNMLRNIMMDEGFAPYDGEWWHFSYGDKEWAFYYKKEKALYNQVDASKVYKGRKIYEENSNRNNG